ncbi:MAG TPA: chlorite dismutase family protein [Pyrinomonadaceae bacterium]|nr:chlorite dismutase family protein [Acidobacteriota bacterium]HQZ97410.1 chlorite dismutase family protein [Pyrinomonadaceae bacterium]
MTKELLHFQKEASEIPLRLVPEMEEVPELSAVEKQFVNFTFLRVIPEWRALDDETKGVYKAEFAEIFESFRDDFLLFSYSLVGFDSRADLMLWRVARSLDLIQDMTARLNQTNLGRFIETADNYLSVTRRMMFIDGPGENRQRVRAGSAKYHFFYPCAKDQEWFEMPSEERDKLIEENFMVGKRFPNIKIHLTHAFGFKDTEYLVSFETDEPRDFLALAEELRRTPASKMTLRGVPIYTCRRRSLMECLDALG